MTRTKQQVVEEMCRLRSLVCREVFAYGHPSDCICGLRERLDGHSRQAFLDDGVVVRFIRAAVVEKIAAVKQGRLRRTRIVRPIP